MTPHRAEEIVRAKYPTAMMLRGEVYAHYHADSPRLGDSWLSALDTLSDEEVTIGVHPDAFAEQRENWWIVEEIKRGKE